MNMYELMASSRQLDYNILASTPSETTGEIMTHEAIKESLKLDDITAARFKKQFNNDVDMGNEYERD